MFAANEEIKLKHLGNKVSVFRVSLQKKYIYIYYRDLGELFVKWL